MAILLAKVNTNNVPDSPGKWYAGQIVTAVPDDFVGGGAESLEAGVFYRIKVLDKTVEEASEYLQAWAHDPTTVQISANGNDRVIEVTSSMVSVSGANAFDATAIDNMLADINTDYPTANALRTDLTNTTFRFSITAPLAARDELIERVNEAVRNMQYARRVWYVTQAGMDYLAANGGYVEGTAAQVATYLRNGLLD